MNEAALNAARYNQKVVRMHDFEYAKDKVLMGSERRSMIITDAEKRVTAIHEAGHALLTVLLPQLVSPFAIYLCKIYSEASVPDEIMEAALALVFDRADLPASEGGVLTPATGIGDVLRPRVVT